MARANPFGGRGKANPFNFEALKAVSARRDANDAASAATNQYEADVADFKNTRATEIEQGIAALPASPSRKLPKMRPTPVMQPPMPPPVMQPPPMAPPIMQPPPMAPPPMAPPPMMPPGIHAPVMKPPMTRPFDPWHGLPPPGKPDIDWEGLPPPPPYPYVMHDNYYTGKPIKNVYRPYSTDSGTVPLKRKLTPEEFGQVPAPPISLDPPRPPPDIWIDPRERDGFPVKGANNGGYLNKGISQLPMNGQGDTLTTQVFQSGFRPRR